MLLAYLVSLLLVSGVAAAQSGASTTELRELVVDGLTRSYEVFVPAEVGDPLPLLVVLHGRGGSGAGMSTATDLDELAAAIVAYPDGMDGQWNYLTGLGGNDGVDDVRFVHELVAELLRSTSVDPARIYVAGYSNGGFMVQRLACEADSPFNAFATVAGAGFGGMPQLCDQPRPLKMMLVHGTVDEVVPWSGQVGLVGGRELLLSASVPQTFAFWANFAGCDGASDRQSIPLSEPASGSVEVLTVTDCPEGAEVVLYAVVGGGHDWPRLADTTGSGSGFDASRIVLEFFDMAENQE